jgi:hypothetical protein
LRLCAIANPYKKAEGQLKVDFDEVNAALFRLGTVPVDYILIEDSLSDD